MAANSSKAGLVGVTLLTLVLSAAPLWSASAVVGSVAGGSDATIGERPLLPNTTLFSGDSLQVKDGCAIVALSKGSRVLLGRETEASFDRATNQVTVALSRGSVSMLRPVQGIPVRVKIGLVSILAGGGFTTEGDVAMVDSLVVVTANEGSLMVEGVGRSMEVKKGNTMTIKNASARAPSGQAGPTASAARVGSNLVTPIAIAAAAATTGVVAGLARSKNSTAETDFTNASTASQSAASSAASAQQAAAAALAAANAACEAISPSDTNCPVH